MPIIIPPGFALARLIWTQTGDAENMISTVGLRLIGGVTDPVAVAEEVRQDWIGAWPAAALSNQNVFQGVSVTMGSDGGDGPTGESIVPVAGTSSSQALPSNCALLVRKATSFGGRRNRGRMYLPSGYLAEGTVDQNGIINGAVLTSLQNQMNAFYSAITAEGNADLPVILHSSSPATPTQINSFQVQQKIATQRRRLRP